MRLNMSPKRLSLVKQFYEFVIDDQLYSPPKDSFDRIFNLRFGSVRNPSLEGTKPTLTVDCLLHDLVFRLGPFFSTESIEGKRYLEMLDAVATCMYWDRMAEIKASRQVLGEKPSIVQIFKCPWINKHWVINRLLSFDVKSEMYVKELISDEEAKAALYSFTSKIFIEDDPELSDRELNVTRRSLGRIAHHLALNGDQDLFLLILQVIKGSPVIGCILSNLADPAKVIFTKLSRRLVYCLPDPLAFADCQGFAEYVFPVLGIQEKLEVLARWMTIETRNESAMAKLVEDYSAVVNICGCPEEVFALVEFMMDRSLTKDDAFAAKWVLKAAYTFDHIHYQRLAKITHPGHIALWAGAPYDALDRFIIGACRVLSTRQVIEIANLMVQVKPDCKKERLANFVFESAVNQTGSVKNAGEMALLEILPDQTTFYLPDCPTLQETGGVPFDRVCDAFIPTAIRMILSCEKVMRVYIDQILYTVPRPCPPILLYMLARRHICGLFALVQCNGRVVPISESLLYNFDDCMNAHDFKFTTSQEFALVKEAAASIGMDL